MIATLLHPGLIWSAEILLIRKRWRKFKMMYQKAYHCFSSQRLHREETREGSPSRRCHMQGFRGVAKHLFSSKPFIVPQTTNRVDTLFGFPRTKIYSISRHHLPDSQLTSRISDNEHPGRSNIIKSHLLGIVLII